MVPIVRLRPREIAGADKVMPGMLLLSASGNLCSCWPAMKVHPDETRIVFWTEWESAPSPADADEFQAFTNQMFEHENAPVLPPIPGDFEEVVAATAEFLRGGPKEEVN